MTASIRALLDNATAQLEPRTPDPVAAVIARGRAARRRTFVAGALAVLVVLGGGAVVGRQLMRADEPPPAPAAPTGPPPTPRQVGNTIVAGDLILPVPPGMRVVPADSTLPCGMLTNAVVLSGPDNGGCRLGPIEVSAVRDTNPSGGVALDASGRPDLKDGVITAPVAITLPGGEPGWLMDATTSEINRPRPGFNFWNTLLLPWSRVVITLRVDGPEQQRIIDSIRTTPGAATRLVLPGTVATADLAMPNPADRNLPYGHRSTDPTTIAAVLRLLRGQKTVVDNDHACTNPSQPRARLTLHAPRPQAAVTTVVITLADNCREAVSSDGGRVRLSADAVRTLKHLFGVAQ